MVEAPSAASGSLATPAFPRIIELAGSPRERGQRHGELLAREIRRVRRGLLHYLSSFTLYAGALPLLAVFQWLSRLSFWSHIPTRLQAELKGVAAGAQIDLSLVILINTLDDLANNWAACSALAVGEGRTSQGFYLAGRNLDYPVFVDLLVDLQTLFLMIPEDGAPLASLAWPGYAGVLTGMNRAGLALIQLTAMCRDHTLKGFPAGLRHRLGLEGETTIPGLIANLIAAKRTMGNNVLLVSPKEASVLEVSAHSFAVRRPLGGLLTITNHFQSAEMAGVKGVFPRRPPMAVLSPYHFTEAYSQARNARLQELATGRRVLGAADLQTFLGDPGVANPGTVNGVVFDPAALTLWIAQSRQPPVSQGEFAQFKLWEARP